MSKNPDRAVHIDIVDSNDRRVLLAHTRELLSIGIIHDLNLICFITDPYNQRSSTPPTLALAHIPDEKTSLDFIGQLVNNWSLGQSILRSFGDKHTNI